MFPLEDSRSNSEDSRSRATSMASTSAVARLMRGLHHAIPVSTSWRARREDWRVHDGEKGAEVSEDSHRGAGSKTRIGRHREEVGALCWRCTAAEARDDPTVTWAVQRQPGLPQKGGP